MASMRVSCVRDGSIIGMRDSFKKGLRYKKWLHRRITRGGWNVVVFRHQEWL